MSIKLSMAKNGRVLIPAELREVLGLREGGELICEVRDGELVLSTRAKRLQDSLALFRETFPQLVNGPSLADELIAERRAEAAREEGQG